MADKELVIKDVVHPDEPMVVMTIRLDFHNYHGPTLLELVIVPKDIADTFIYYVKTNPQRITSFYWGQDDWCEMQDFEIEVDEDPDTIRAAQLLIAKRILSRSYDLADMILECIAIDLYGDDFDDYDLYLTSQKKGMNIVRAWRQRNMISTISLVQ